MKNLAILILFISVYSCVRNQKSETQINSKLNQKSVSELNDFEMINDFESNKAEFNTDTFKLYNHSTDAGELIVFHESESDYVVLDFWLYGETGKLNYTYWTDNDFKFKFIRKISYEYNKPYYEGNYKTDSVIQYLSYSNSEFRLFDSNKNEINDPELVKSTKSELDGFYNDMIKEIEIIK